MSSELGDKKAVRIKDLNNTIILIDKDEDPKKAIKKYMQDLQDYRYSNMKDLSKPKNYKF